MIDYFKNSFNKDVNIQDLYKPNNISSLINIEDNIMLTSTPTKHEIWGTLDDMNIDSIVGPDGYITLFFKLLGYIKHDLFEASKDFFNMISIPRFFTSTSIILIPKKDNPKPRLILDL